MVRSIVGPGRTALHPSEHLLLPGRDLRSRVLWNHPIDHQG
jgi:hypothetical protein